MDIIRGFCNLRKFIILEMVFVYCVFIKDLVKVKNYLLLMILFNLDYIRIIIEMIIESDNFLLEIDVFFIEIE